MPIVLTPLVSSTTSFDDMVDDVSVHLPGCPQPMIAHTIRKVVVDMCQRAKVWVSDFRPITLVPGQVNYALQPVETYAVCTDVVSGHVVIGGAKTELSWEPLEAVKRQFPSWPTGVNNTPQVMTWATLGEVMLAPVPDVAGTLYLRGYLRPAPDATVWDSALYNEFSRVIFHGTLYELMLTPNRSWSDAKVAALHGRHWTQLLAAARDRAQRGFNADDLSVAMLPFA